MPEFQTGNSQPSIDFEEHRHLSRTKGVSVYGTDGAQFNALAVNADGSITVVGSISSAQAVTAFIAASTTLYAVVNTGAAGAQSVTAWIAQSVTLNAVVNTASPQVTVFVGGSLPAANTTAWIAGSVTLQMNFVEVRQANAASLNAHVIGDKAADSAVPSNPVIVGGRASTAAPASVDADDDAQYFWLDRAGRTAVWDGNNSLSIDDGGNSLTVDGGVTAWIAGTFTGFIAGTVTANGIITGTVTLSGLPASATDADDLANAASVPIQSRTYEYDGNEGNWDRVRHSYYQRTTNVSGGTSTTAINMTECPCQFYTLQIVKNGTVTAFNIDFEGSMDSAVWFLIANRTSATGANEATHHVTKPWRYVRVTANTITGGGTEIIDILCMR